MPTRDRRCKHQRRCNNILLAWWRVARGIRDASIDITVMCWLGWCVSKGISDASKRHMTLAPLCTTVALLCFCFHRFVLERSGVSKSPVYVAASSRHGMGPAMPPLVVRPIKRHSTCRLVASNDLPHGLHFVFLLYFAVREVFRCVGVTAAFFLLSVCRHAATTACTSQRLVNQSDVAPSVTISCPECLHVVEIPFRFETR